MKTFNSCLFPLFQEFYERIKNGNYSLPDSIHESDDIQDTNIDNSILPTHLSTFIVSLEKSENPESILSAIKTALIDADSCNLCYSCQKCAHQFYLSIAELIIPDYLEESIIKQKQTLAILFGELSFRKAPSYLNQHFDSHDDLWQNYLQSNEQNQYERKIDNKLIVLKGMSSSSPYIYNEIYTTHTFTGGGFYLRYKGFGIAIDPGYGFVENMRRNKITIQDIDAVIITHCHIDHTNDMRLIDDLNHQFQSKRHTIHWYVDETTYKDYYHGFDEKINICTIVQTPHLSNEIFINKNISIIPFKTEHIFSENKKEEYNSHTFGFVLKLKLATDKYIKIGYTSDTRYYDNLEKSLEGSNIIIANISSLYYDDYLLVKQKPKHLGYRGCYYILQNLIQTPEIFIVSEFWSGTTDLRLDVCKALNHEKKGNGKIIPGDVGLHIDFLNSKIKCTRCGKYQYISDIYSVKPNTDFDTIEYICKDCLL